jgi:hypothetical protein
LLRLSGYDPGQPLYTVAEGFPHHYNSAPVETGVSKEMA